MGAADYPLDQVEDLERAVLAHLITAYKPAGDTDWMGDVALAEVERAARDLVAALDAHRVSRPALAAGDRGQGVSEEHSCQACCPAWLTIEACLEADVVEVQRFTWALAVRHPVQWMRARWIAGYAAALLQLTRA